MISVDTVIVLSGGMDSAVLLANTIAQNKTVTAISFDYGSKHNARELPMAAAICQARQVDHKIVHLPFINDIFTSSLLQSGEAIPDGHYEEETMKRTVVPFRNGILMAIAVGLAESSGAGEVLLGSHVGDHFIYPDCRPEFNAAFAEAAYLGTDRQVEVKFPFADLDKRDIGDLGRRLGVDFKQTWTCYKGNEMHCGTCGACQERKYALRQEEGLDPTIYEN